MQSIPEYITHLYDIVSSEDFLLQKSLGGEIPFFIAPYKAEKQLEIDTELKGLKNRLGNAGISLLELNLYDLSMEIIEKELGTEEIFALEQEVDKDEFKEALQSVLDIHEVLMPVIRERINASNAKVYFLTGIGLVFPFIRSHNILNNLQNIAKKAPTVAFFPGDYNGQSLELFGLLKDDNYYRAFNIEQYNVKA